MNAGFAMVLVSTGTHTVTVAGMVDCQLWQVAKNEALEMSLATIANSKQTHL